MDERPSVYIETSLLSYLAARPSSNLIVAAQQELSRQWWELRRSEYQLFVSKLVLEESNRGDPDAARRRLEYAADMPLLELDDETYRLSRMFLDSGTIPIKAQADAAHVAVATRHNVEYVLTWNCRHIANATIKRRLAALLWREGYEIPAICTPYELFGRD